MCVVISKNSAVNVLVISNVKQRKLASANPTAIHLMNRSARYSSLKADNLLHLSFCNFYRNEISALSVMLVKNGM